MNYLLDLLLVGLLVLFFLRGWKKGFVACLCDLVGVVLAAVIAVMVGSWLADWAYETFMRAPLAERIAAALSSSSPDVVEIQAMIGAFPAFIVRALEHYGITAQSLYGAAATATGPVSVTLADAVSPVIVAVLRFFIVLLLFFALLIVVRIVSKLLTALFSLPLVRELNGALGGVLNLLKGLVVVWLLCVALNLLVPMLGEGTRAAVEGWINASWVFDVIYRHNPILGFLL